MKSELAMHPVGSAEGATDGFRLPVGAAELASGILDRAHRFWADHLATLEWARMSQVVQRDVGHMATDPGVAREHDRAAISAWIS